jgi:hypothetical protein
MSMLRRQLWAVQAKIFVLFWAVLALGLGTYSYLTSRLAGLQVSLWDVFGQAPPKYFLVIAGIVAAYIWLPVYVAHGVTRRDYSLASALFYGATCAAFGALSAVLYVIDRLARSATAPLPPWHGPWFFVHTSILFLLWFCSGWLISGAFYRFGILGGILFVPIGSLPAIIGEIVLNTDVFLNEPPQPRVQTLVRIHFATPVATGIGLLAVAGAMAAGYWMVRQVPIRKISG